MPDKFLRPVAKAFAAYVLSLSRDGGAWRFVGEILPGCVTVTVEYTEAAKVPERVWSMEEAMNVTVPV